MIECKGCGTANPPGSRYCVNCARSLDEDTQQAVAAQRSQEMATGIRWPAIYAALAAVIVIVVVVLFVTHVI